MKLKWDNNSDAYEAASKIILEKYEHKGESIVVQLKLRYDCESEYHETTTLLLNDGENWLTPKWIWENDWWEGEQDVELIAAAPIEDIDISEHFAL